MKENIVRELLKKIFKSGLIVLVILMIASIVYIVTYNIELAGIIINSPQRFLFQTQEFIFRGLIVVILTLGLFCFFLYRIYNSKKKTQKDFRNTLLILLTAFISYVIILSASIGVLSQIDKIVFDVHVLMYYLLGLQFLLFGYYYEMKYKEDQGADIKNIFNSFGILVLPIIIFIVTLTFITPTEFRYSLLAFGISILVGTYFGLGFPLQIKGLGSEQGA